MHSLLLQEILFIEKNFYDKKYIRISRALCMDELSWIIDESVDFVCINCVDGLGSWISANSKRLKSTGSNLSIKYINI
jgi:hypothetical protein